MLQKESNIHQEVSILSQISQRIGVFLNSSDKFSPVHHGYLQLVQNSNPNLPKEISSTSLASAILKEKEKQVEDAKQVNSKQSEQNNSTSSKPSSKAKSVLESKSSHIDKTRKLPDASSATSSKNPQTIQRPKPKPEPEPWKMEKSMITELLEKYSQQLQLSSLPSVSSVSQKDPEKALNKKDGNFEKAGQMAFSRYNFSFAKYQQIIKKIYDFQKERDSVAYQSWYSNEAKIEERLFVKLQLLRNREKKGESVDRKKEYSVLSNEFGSKPEYPIVMYYFLSYYTEIHSMLSHFRKSLPEQPSQIIDSIRMIWSQFPHCLHPSYTSDASFVKFNHLLSKISQETYRNRVKSLLLPLIQKAVKLAESYQKELINSIP